MHGLIDKERNLNAEKQRLYSLVVKELACATRSTDAERTTLRRKGVQLMNKATKSALAANECHQQFNDSRTALAVCKKKLMANLDAVAGTVCYGLTKAWGMFHCPRNFCEADQVSDPVQKPLQAHELLRSSNVLSSTLLHPPADEAVQNNITFGYPRKPRRCQSWPSFGARIATVAANEGDEGPTFSFIEGSNITSCLWSEKFGCSIGVEEAWPGSSSDADTSPDDS